MNGNGPFVSELVEEITCHSDQLLLVLQFKSMNHTNALPNLGLCFTVPNFGYIVD